VREGTSSASLWTRYPEAWDMLMFGLRLGNDPRAVVTTTPEPIKIRHVGTQSNGYSVQREIVDRAVWKR
jgi:phage terminase large subunit-like protein